MPKIKKSIKRILFCAAEAAPLAKVGGLADVVGSLPLALKKQKIEARVLMPAHSFISLKKIGAQKLASFSIIAAGKPEKVFLFKARVRGITYYLLKNKHYFTGNVYEGDNCRKYLFFCRAVLTALPFLPFRPEIIHAHDFHAAPLIMELSRQARPKRPGLILTIHNLQYQGWTENKTVAAFGFNKADFPDAARSQDGQWLNLLSGGLVGADKITTVSPNYAREILTPAYGQGLEKLLRSRRHDLVGILNGLNLEEYNPEQDKLLAENYNQRQLQSGKALNKRAIKDYLGFAADEAPLLVLIARFSEQKGLDLFNCKLLGALAKKYPFHLVLLGSGEKKYEALAENLERNLPGNVRTIIAFSEPLAHNLYAAADYFLVPSRFEPCGLTQMIAMHYGAVPIVRGTGGLKDTVKNNKTGLVFKNYSTSAFIQVLEKALRLYYQDRKKYQSLRLAGRKQNWSWAISAPIYRQLYEGIDKSLK